MKERQAGAGGSAGGDACAGRGGDTGRIHRAGFQNDAQWRDHAASVLASSAYAFANFSPAACGKVGFAGYSRGKRRQFREISEKCRLHCSVKSFFFFFLRAARATGNSPCEFPTCRINRLLLSDRRRKTPEKTDGMSRELYYLC